MSGMNPKETISEIPMLLDWLIGDAAIREAFFKAMGDRGFVVTGPVLPEPVAAPVDESPALPAMDYGEATELVNAMKRMGHEVFTRKGLDYNLNIVAVRDTSPVLDAYGCRLYVFWQEPAGNWRVLDWAITTYPGSHYLIRKIINRKGTAILAEGQYKGVYKIDLHNGKYPALCQRGGNVTVYRDNNRDRTFDMKPETHDPGRHGINVHAPITPGDGLKNYVDELVDASSAGCLVFRQMRDFAAFMSLCHKAKAIWGNSFTLTLMKDTDLTGGLTLDPVSPVPVKEEVSGLKFQVSKEGLDLIRHFESCLKPVGNGWFEAYADPAHGWRVPTIGWGTIAYEDGTQVMRGDRISQARADELLAWESAEKVRGVRELVTVPLNDDQLAALVSFAYNVGLGNFKSSTMLRLLNEGDYAGAAGQFPRWNKANGLVMRGLTRRRLSEQNLFLGQRPFIVPA